MTTPNAPSGRGYDTAALEVLCRAQRGVIVLDEAYSDFAGAHALSLALKYPARARGQDVLESLFPLSAAHRYMVGHPALVAALDTIRDSYSVNGLGQVAAAATLTDLPYYRANIRAIIRTRTGLTRALTALGFEVLPSQTNFLLTKPPAFPAREWLRRLRDRKILVRWFGAPEVRDYLRITIGTEAEAAMLVTAVTQILRPSPARQRGQSKAGANA